MVQSSNGPSIEEKRKRLARLLKERSNVPLSGLPGETQTARQSGLVSLSFGQEALWFEAQKAASSPVYNIAVAIRIHSRLNIPALERAVATLVARHEQLRTRYPANHGYPQALVDADVSNIFEALAIGEVGDAVLQQQVNQAAQAPFVLDQGSLIRVRLYSLAEQAHLLLLVVHHLVADGWSTWLLLEELQVLYGGEKEGKPAHLEELTSNYQDYVSWQRDSAAGDRWCELRDFWEKQFAKRPPRLDLPADRSRPRVQSFRGAVEHFELEPELLASLRRLSHQERVTLVSLLMAAFQVFLFRLTQQEEFVVGLPSMGRGLTRYANVVGYFVNPLPLRARVHGRLPFRQLLAQVNERIKNALVHQDFPFPLLIRELQLERNPSRPPFFETVLVYHKPQRQEMHIQGLAGDNQRYKWGNWEVAPFELERVTSIYDLTFQVTELGDNLVAEFEYNSDLFDKESIRAWTIHFQNLLRGIVTRPEQRIGRLPVLSENQGRQMLVEWNQTQVERPPNITVDQLFEAQADRTPTATAVTDHGITWTYEELNRRANRLAHYLLNWGLKPGGVAGIHLPRWAGYLAAVLAVLKAGAAYLPLEITFPPGRLAFMAADAGATVIVTESGELFANKEGESFASGDGQPVTLSPAQARDQIARQSGDNLPELGDADYPAYILYTSGSTGQPKGSMIGHRAVVNLLLHIKKKMNLGPADVWSVQSTITFDASVVEMFMPLATGASMNIVSHEEVVDGFGLVKALEESRATHTISTPSLWDLIQASGWRGGWRVQALVGGENLVRHRIQQLMETGVVFTNLYGQTETAVYCTSEEITPDFDLITVGRPIDNAQIYILDEELEPVPLGAPGEIFVGGAPVGIGYINRPALTASYFIPNPFSDLPGARLYRSGDRGRYLHDGTIQFLGRMDQQLKIRGYRVEPGEIEKRIDQHSQVRSSIVLAKQRLEGDLQLVAYVQPERGETVTGHDLTLFLKKQLPTYMIPAAFQVLAEFPRTSSGKVDRFALPPVSFEEKVEKGALQVPRTELERIITRLMAEVLALDRVGLDDDFFELGGHSLMAMRLLALIQLETDRRLPMADFLARPNVRDTAAVLSKTTAGDRESSPLIEPRTSGKTGSFFPLTQGQIALWYVDCLAPEQTLYNLPSVWRIKGRLDLLALEQALIALVTRHDLLRSRLRDGSEPAWEILSPETFFLDKVDPGALEQDQGQSLSAAWRARARRPFDLLAEIPFRATVFTLAPEDHLLLLVVHHIVLDGWSSEIILGELGRLYRAFAQDQPLDLPETALRFGDYALWQQETLNSGALEGEITYWREKLAGLPVLKLGQTRQAPAGPIREAVTVRLPLPDGLIQPMKELGQRHKANIFTTLLAAFQVWLYRHTCQREFGVGIPVSGRHQPETGRLVGYLINMLVMRAQIEPSLPFTETIGNVRAGFLEALKYQTLPFEKVVKAVQPQREVGQNPLFQVMFTAELDLPPVLELGLVEVEEIRETSLPPQFDLVMNLIRLPEGLAVDLIFDQQLFERAEMELMSDRFLTLLQSLVADPQQPLCLVQILPDRERRQLLVDWNNTARDYPREVCVHQLFEEQVTANPAARAVVFQGGSWDYARLNGSANRLARYLRGRGVRSGDIVCVKLQRSPEFIAAMLAIFKAGCVYLPLDPNLPQARLQFMVTDSSARGIITDRDGLWPTADPELLLVNLEREAKKIAAYPTGDLVTNVGATDPASVIYTSGSSGQPKGALVSHRSLVNVLTDKRQRLQAGPGDLMLSHLNVAFDASLAEIWMPLTSGAAVYLAGWQNSIDLDRLIKAMTTCGATMMHVTPDMLPVLLESEQWDGHKLKMFCGGGKLQRPLANRALRRGVRLVNAYGPTEATIMATAHLVAEGQDDVPIGRPISNARIYILDEEMQPQPVGVPGEIFIGGVSPAIGYLNRPELTAEYFITDPFSEQPGARLYRSGDFARYRPDGNIEFIGRRDRQVKVRGFRIELGDIESCLFQHENIDQVAVEARQVSASDKRLVAYLVPKQGQPVAGQEVKRYLAERLPAYMVPSAFVNLEEMPLTANGKVDHAALPAPDWGATVRSHPHLEPRNATERKVAAIWAELLRTSAIGVEDDFFDLGGHSLLAVQLINRIEAEFGRRLPLVSFLEEATIEAQARALLPDQVKAGRPTLVPLRSDGVGRPLFMVTAGFGDILALNQLVKQMAPGCPVYGLQPDSPAGQPPPSRSLDEQLDAYLAEINSRQGAGPIRLAGYCSGGLLAFALAARLAQMGETVDPLALLEAPISYPAYLHYFFRFWRSFNIFLIHRLGLDWSKLPRSLEPEFIDEGLKAHLDALCGYRSTVYPGRVTLIMARHSHMRVLAGPKRWSHIAQGGVETRLVPGSHENFMREEKALNVARQLDQLLKTP